MLGSNPIYINSKLFGNSLNQLSKDYDIMFFNFEGTIGNINKDQTHPKCSEGKYCFTFMSPEDSPELLNSIKNKDTKIIFNMANNHSLDYGANIQQQTYDRLSKYGNPIGYLKQPVQEIIVDNQKIVFIGASPHNGSLSIFSDKLPLLVKKYKAQNDIVIVSLHMGAEGNDKYWVSDRDEIFAYQNRGNIYKLSHELIDIGADLIIGHGPHVIRGIEKYKDKAIFYSLGNFLTYGNFSLTDKKAMSTLVEVSISKNTKNIIGGKIFGYEQTKSINNMLWNKGTAIQDEDNTAKWMIKLSKENFKNTFEFKKDNTFK